ncbi:MAG: UPF0175 family protein [Planctomycetes bacterium]|nr:UPF0175 family protein [Planctomycetota bacterium]
MPLTIPDDLLRETGMNEEEARVEIACRLFQADRLSLPAAARWAGLPRIQFEAELVRRGIAPYRPTVEDLESDLATLGRLGV